MEYRTFGPEDLGEVVRLYEAAGWQAYLNDESALTRAFKQSLFVLGVFEGKRMIAFARCVGDGEHIVYVQDLIVDPCFQRQGIGTQLMRHVFEHFAHVRMITLMTDAADERANMFYLSLGMKRCADGGLACYFY